MGPNETDLLDREERVFSCFQTAISLIDPNKERDILKVEELLNFLAEEYNQALKAWRRTCLFGRFCAQEEKELPHSAERSRGRRGLRRTVATCSGYA